MDQAELQIKSQTSMANVQVQKDRLNAEDQREAARINARIAEMKSKEAAKRLPSMALRSGPGAKTNQMVESVFYPVLRDIDEQKKAVELHLANGGAKTQEDYWRLVGGYEAISRVEDMLKDTEARYDDN
jgi:hypothetical protein